MKHINKNSGFTAVELLITLFIAAAFLMSGYQLYGLIIKDSGDVRATANASNKANEYLQTYKTYATNPCSNTIPSLPTDLSVPITNLTNTTLTVAITCPYGTATPSISKITVTLKYGKPQKTINIATYVKP